MYVYIYIHAYKNNLVEHSIISKAHIITQHVLVSQAQASIHW